MDLRQLRYFVSIVDHASLSKAAERLHVAQPALSQHVRHLEEELRVKLLIRGARGVTTTEPGRRLHHHARHLLAQLDALPDLVRAGDDDPVGEVRLGMSGTVSELVTVPLIEDACLRYPGVRIRPVEAMSGYVLEWLRRGEIDAAIVYGTTDPVGVTTHHVLTEELCLFGRTGSQPPGVAPDTTIALAHVLKLDLITPGGGHGLRDLVDAAAASIRGSVKPAFEIDSYSQIKALSAKGFGYGILPEMAVAREAREHFLSVWHIVDPVIKRKIFIAYRPDLQLSAATAAVVRLSHQVIRRLVHKAVWIATLPEDSPSDSLTL
jgi:LysR family nitrogen assimilation transcriptional regulator